MKSRYSNEFKAEVLTLGLDKHIKKVKRESSNLDYFVYLHDNWSSEIDCACKLNESYYRKAKKVREKIGQLVEDGNAIFVTLTFSDITLSKTSVLTRRKYVARYLKANSSFYVANIDFGGKNGREHYHAVVSKDLDFSSWYKYGAVKVERVHNTHNDLMAVSKYVSKLTNHALKVKGLQPRLIYSRNMA